MGHAIAGSAIGASGCATSVWSASNNAFPDTGSVARFHSPKPIAGVVVAALVQSLPFQSQVAAFAESETPQPVEIYGMLRFPPGSGASAGCADDGGIHLVELDEPEPAEPEPDEPVDSQTVPPSGAAVTRWPPTSRMSWLTGSYVICAPDSPGGEVAGCACVHAEPFQVQVSPRLPDLPSPPNMTTVPSAASNAIAASLRAGGWPPAGADPAPSTPRIPK